MKLISYSCVQADIISSGAQPVLAMGVAPEAIVEFLFEYRLSLSSSVSRIFDFRNIRPFYDTSSTGCATSTPDESSPRGYDGIYFCSQS
jgi:hypothetical protein